ncbi:MAG TPA: sugar phosphate isomerase/epimerase [Gemmatimonadaceae bacterium]|nr:sugar phosphate isomerase/epimerase [Gemmatimonadaceae bacterium]
MERNRREFLKDAAALGAGAWLLGACGRSVSAAASAAANAALGRPSIQNAGIQLFTVRDRLGPRFEETLAALAAIGYREVEPFTYNDWTPEQIRGMLDRTGLRAPSTHVTLHPGPDLERQLAGFQAMGHRYGRAGAAPPPRPAGAPNGRPPGGFTMPVPTLDSVRKEIDVYHEVARAAKPYGIKVIVHNHTMEFTRLADGRTPFDVMLAELDPSLVALELDIGWATVAGQSAVALFDAHPGRYPLWHVKDMANLAAVNANGGDQMARMRAARIVPLGQGEIDYGPIFARAGTAGLEHFFVEQDTAPDSGDSIAAARTSFEALRRILQG